MGKYNVGDKVQVKYLTGTWIDVTVVRIDHIDAARAERLKDAYPSIRAGDEILLCGQDINDTDTRAFLPDQGQVRPMAEAEAEAKALKNMETTKRLKVMPVLRLRKPGAGK